MFLLFFGRKKEESLTLVEVLVAMLILSTSAAGIIGSFSYAFKFVMRAGAKLEAMNVSRFAQEKYRAIWIKDPEDTRLAIVTDKDITSEILTDMGNYPYGAKIKLTIKNWPSDTAQKQIDIKMEW